MSTHEVVGASKSGSLLSKRRVAVAGIAAVLGCAACCAVPLLALAGVGGSAAAAWGRTFRPGSEPVVGLVIFAAVLGILAIRARLGAQAGCGAACKADSSCCDRGTRVSRS